VSVLLGDRIVCRLILDRSHCSTFIRFRNLSEHCFSQNSICTSSKTRTEIMDDDDHNDGDDDHGGDDDEVVVDDDGCAVL